MFSPIGARAKVWRINNVIGQSARMDTVSFAYATSSSEAIRDTSAVISHILQPLEEEEWGGRKKRE